MNLPIILFGKLFSFFSKTFNLGNGSTWPGHIALNLNENFISDVLKKSKTKVIVVTGTNGKTTTSKLLETILKQNGKTVSLNTSGANLVNGVASSLIIHSDLSGKMTDDYAIFEIDENNLSLLTEKVKPDFLIALNLFRDQLDRYGEIDSIAKKWKETYSKLSDTVFFLNADDPQIAYLGRDIKSKKFFGLEIRGDKEHQHASDSILCPNCGNKLSFERFYFSHLGKWECQNCRFKRPKPDITSFSYFPLVGDYAAYDTLAAVLISRNLGINDKDIESALRNFKPAFGRQEEIMTDGKSVKVFLSKNPTSFNESLRTIAYLNPKHILIVLNDRIPDGLDVSWIWDVDFEELIPKDTILFLSGDRVFDLATRLKYAGLSVSSENIFDDLEKGIKKSLEKIFDDDTLYVVPTYSAMLEVRKSLSGRKIL